jgi:hypothetical protein
MCGADLDGPRKLIVSHPSVKSWEVDLCDACYDQYYSWQGRREATPTIKTAGRPQVRLHRTVLPPQPGATPQAASG